MIKWSSSELSSSLKKLKITPSYFVKNVKDILKDEEYIDKNDNVKKCFFCDSLNIKHKDIANNYKEVNSDLVLDFLDELDYLYKEKDEFRKVIDGCISLSKLNSSNLPILYCDNCKKILKIGKHFTLVALNMETSLYFELLKEEGTIDDNGFTYNCPCCGHQTFKKENIYYDEVGEVEYDIICNKCNYNISHFAYGSYYFE